MTRLVSVVLLLLVRLVVMMIGLVVVFGWIGEGSQELKELPRTLYPN